MLPGFSKSFTFLESSLGHSSIADSVYAHLFNSRQLIHDSRSASAFSVARSAVLANKPEHLQYIKQLSLDYPRILTLTDKEGYNLIYLAYKFGSKDLENFFTDTVRNNFKEEYVSQIFEHFEELKVKDLEALALQQQEAEMLTAKQQKEFAAGTVIGKIALHPGLEYLDDSITGYTRGKALQDYYYEQFSLSSLLQEGAYYGLSVVLAFIPKPVKFTNNPKYNKALASSIVMAPKIVLDIATHQFEISWKYAGNLAGFIVDSLASYGVLIGSQQIGLYAKSPIITGAIVSVVPDIRKITSHSIDKLLESPQPAELRASEPVKYNPYQKLAIKFHINEIYVTKFNNQHQITAYKMLRSAEKAVKITNFYQIKALEKGAELDTALKYSSKIQYVALVTYHLPPEEAVQITRFCQLEALKNGESFEEVIVTICGDVNEL